MPGYPAVYTAPPALFRANISEKSMSSLGINAVYL